MMGAAWIVYLKELQDALRDRRTLLMVLLSSVAIGPLVLVAVSQLVGSIEKRAEAREIVVVGLEHAPGLRNFFERQTYTVATPPTAGRSCATASWASRCWWSPGFQAEVRGQAPVLNWCPARQPACPGAAGLRRRAPG
jgi:sodium transport system permease protein